MWMGGWVRRWSSVGGVYAQQSIRFKKHSTQLKQAMWWQNAKLMIFVGVVVVVVLAGISYSWKK